jgi:hypothetical protein
LDRHGVSFTFIQPGSRTSNARYASIAFVSGLAAREH